MARLPSRKKICAQYGRNLGMAFQLVDDVLDLTASESILGKPVASDLREGKVTMAVIHALELCEPKERVLIETVLKDRSFDTVPYTKIQEILRKYCSVEAASARAMQYAEAACNAIADFPDSEIKRALLVGSGICRSPREITSSILPTGSVHRTSPGLRDSVLTLRSGSP